MNKGKRKAIKEGQKRKTLDADIVKTIDSLIKDALCEAPNLLIRGEFRGAGELIQAMSGSCGKSKSKG